MSNIREMFDEYGVYNIRDVISNFEEITNISFISLIAKLDNNNNNIITKEEIINYCNNNFSNLYESKYNKIINEEIINRRLIDYDTLSNIIKVYKKKGIKLINIILYLNNCDKIKIEYYEKKLKEVDIKHYQNIISGRDLIRILEALINLINNYDNYYNKINNYETYNRQNYDFLSKDELPNESLIQDERNHDKTSLSRIKKKKI